MSDGHGEAGPLFALWMSRRYLRALGREPVYTRSKSGNGHDRSK
jgi:hypothetical protein